MKEITAYECEYGCGKFLKTKSGMRRHEKKCFWNPANKACASCGNNEHYSDDDGYRSWEGRWCVALEFDIFTDKYNGRSKCPRWTSKD